MRLMDSEWKVKEAVFGSQSGFRIELSGYASSVHFTLASFPALLGPALFALLLLVPAGSSKRPLVWTASGMSLLALFAYRSKRNDLRFRRYATQNDPISNCNVVRAFAEFHGWEVQRDDEASLLQIWIPEPQSLMSEDGEVLTVLFKGPEIFVNCIPFPSGRSTFPSAWTPAKRRMQAVVEAVDGAKA